MTNAENMDSPKMIKRLNATLPDPLAQFVGQVTGKGGLYETPSEFIRDLIRRYMEKIQARESHDINTLLAKSVAENDYQAWTNQDMQDVRKTIQG